MECLRPFSIVMNSLKSFVLLYDVRAKSYPATNALENDEALGEERPFGLRNAHPVAGHFPFRPRRPHKVWFSAQLLFAKHRHQHDDDKQLSAQQHISNMQPTPSWFARGSHQQTAPLKLKISPISQFQTEVKRLCKNSDLSLSLSALKT